MGMSRLIDADALNAAMYHEAFETDTDMQKWDSGCWIRYKMFEQAIKAAPTIEAEPVRHAHWNGWTAHHWTRKFDDNGDPIYKEHTYYQCSECRRRTVIKSAYCSACGCRMDDELPY